MVKSEKGSESSVQPGWGASLVQKIAEAPLAEDAARANTEAGNGQSLGTMGGAGGCGWVDVCRVPG